GCATASSTARSDARQQKQTPPELRLYCAQGIRRVTPMNAAVETETQPSIPPLIAQLLQKLELPYETCQDTPELAPASRVQAILLEDAAGALLVLFPRDHLLDLPRLTELTDRHLVAVTPERLSRMLEDRKSVA